MTALPFPPYAATAQLRESQRKIRGLYCLEYILREPDAYCGKYWGDSSLVIVYDAFPKSRVHLLVLPRCGTPKKVTDLTDVHLPLLEHMHSVSSSIVAFFQSTQFRGLRFQVGFHALPSLSPLHLHIMSLDFQDAPADAGMRTAKHYNTFATPFFVPLLDVLQRVL